MRDEKHFQLVAPKAVSSYCFGCSVLLASKPVFFCPRLALTIVIAILLTSASPTYSAQWDGDDTDGGLFSYWDNWYGNNLDNQTFNSSTDLEFTENNANHTTLTQDIGYKSVRSIVYASTFSGNTTLGGSDGFNLHWKIENSSSGNQTINVPLVVQGASFELHPINGNLTIGGSIHNPNSRDLLVYGKNGKTLTLNTEFSGSGAKFRLMENSTVLLNTTQSYTGETQLNAGTLRLGASNRISNSSALSIASGATFDLAGYAEEVGTFISSAGGITLGSGHLIVNQSNAGTYSGIMSGTGSFAKKGASMLVFTGANSYSGQTYIDSGELRYNASQNAGNTGTINVGATSGNDNSAVSIGAVNVTLSNPINIRSGSSGAKSIVGQYTSGTGTLSGSITLNADVTLSVVNPSGNLALTGVISGTGTVTKNDPGNLILSGNNAYNGITRINAGLLSIQHNNALGASVITNSAVLRYTANNLTVTNKLVLNTGTLAVLSGTGTGSKWDGEINLVDATANTISAPSTGRLAINGLISGAGSLTKIGADWLILTNANTYSGGTVVSEGELRLQNNRAAGTGTITVAGGALVLNASNLSITNTIRINNGTVTGISGGGTLGGSLTLQNNAYFTGANTITLTGSVHGANGSLTKSGTAMLTLAGATENVSATATVTDGTLVLAKTSSSTVRAIGATDAVGLTINGGTVQLAGTGGDQIYDTTIVNLTGGTFNLNGNSETISGLIGASGAITSASAATLSLANAAANNSYSGIIGGSVSLAKTGTGTQVLLGANTYTGITTINAGTLSVSTLADGGANSGIGASSSSSGNLILGGGVLRYTGSDTTINRGATVTANSGVDVSNSLTLTGAVLGNNSYTLTKLGVGTLTLAGGSDNLNLWVGSAAGTLVLGKTSAGARVAGVRDITTGATVLLSGTTSDQISDSAGFGVSMSGGTFDLNGKTEDIDVLTGTGTVTSGSAAELRVGVGNTSANFAGNISGSVTLTKAGNGTFTLAGANTHVGNTTVSNGILAVSGNLSASSIFVTSAGTLLMQAGSISGGAVVNNNTLIGVGTISPTVSNNGAIIAAHTFGGLSVLSVSLPDLSSGNLSASNNVVLNAVISSGNSFGNNGHIAMIGGSFTINGTGSGIITNSARVSGVGTVVPSFINDGTIAATGAAGTLDVRLLGGTNGAAGRLLAGVNSTLNIGNATVVNQGTIAASNGSGGIVRTSGSIVNEGLITGAGNLTIASATHNLGFITATGGDLTFNAALTNAGTVNIENTGRLQLNDNGVNSGSITLAGGNFSSSTSFTNTTGRIGGHGTITTATGLINLGTLAVSSIPQTLYIGTGNGLAILNSGTIAMFGGILTGSGIITNSVGTVQGYGTLTHSIINGPGGTIRAQDGALRVQSPTGDGTIPFTQTGTLVVENASRMIFGATTNALLANNGTILLRGGAFLSATLTNLAETTGYGTIAANVINSGTLLASSTISDLHLTGGTVVNQVGGVMGASNGRLIVDNVFTNSGTMTFLHSRGTFNDDVVNNGAWIMDPSTNTYNGDFSVTSSGYLTMTSGDVNIFKANFYNESTQSNSWNTLKGKFVFDGGTLTMEVAGLDVGGDGLLPVGPLSPTNEFTNSQGVMPPIWRFTNNFALGTLELTEGTALNLIDAFPGGAKAGLYVQYLDLKPRSLLIINNNVELYYMHTNTIGGISYGDTYTGGNVWIKEGGSFHYLNVVPEPSIAILLTIGGGILYWHRRRKHRA
jgi:autotransporter-associated beta strand protein